MEVKTEEMLPETKVYLEQPVSESAVAQSCLSLCTVAYGL